MSLLAPSRLARPPRQLMVQTGVFGWWFKTPLADLVVAVGGLAFARDVAWRGPGTASLGLLVAITGLVLLATWGYLGVVVRVVRGLPRPGFPHGLPLRTQRHLVRVCVLSAAVCSGCVITGLMSQQMGTKPSLGVVTGALAVLLPVSMVRAILLFALLKRFAARTSAG